MSDIGNMLGKAMKFFGVLIIILLFAGVVSCSYYLEHLRFTKCAP